VFLGAANLNVAIHLSIEADQPVDIIVLSKINNIVSLLIDRPFRWPPGWILNWPACRSTLVPFAGLFRGQFTLTRHKSLPFDVLMVTPVNDKQIAPTLGESLK